MRPLLCKEACGNAAVTLGHLQPSPLTEESLDLAEWGADTLATQAVKLQSVNIYLGEIVFLLVCFGCNFF